MTYEPSDDVSVGGAPTVSVVIPSFERPTYLMRAIDSVLGQTYEHLEVIVVDDNDPATTYREETRRLLQRFAADPRVKVIEHPSNQGQSAARNTGVASARGTYVAFLDDDDAWLPEKLERQLAVFARADADVAVVTCGWTIRDVDGHVIRVEKPRLRGDILEHLALNRIGPPSTALCRREATLAVGGFDAAVRPREDIDFYLRMAMRFRFDFVEEPLVDYLYHDKGISRQSRLKIQAYDRFLHKHATFIGASKRRFSEYRERQGDLHLEIDEVKQARRLFRQAVRADPLRPQPYLKLSATLLGADGYGRARAHYRRLLRRR